MRSVDSLTAVRDSDTDEKQVLYVARVTCDACNSLWRISEIVGGCRKCGNIKFTGKMIPKEKLDHPIRYRLKELWRYVFSV